MDRDTLLETLLNTLEAERYMRGPLLLTIVDELCAGGGLEQAAHEARALLCGLEKGTLVESEFVSRVGSLRHLVHALSAPPESEVRVKEVRETLASAVPRQRATASAA